MLVLTRREMESIVIDDVIVVTVVSIGGDQVQLSIDAPKHMPVHRMEVHEAIQRDARAQRDHPSRDGNPL